MGYGRALLQRDVLAEEASFRKKAKKKSLWGSIGRTVGGLGIMAISGGTLNPVTLGLLSGGASFLGGAIGAKAAGGKLTEGKFFKSDREEAQKELGAFGTQNIVSSLKSGITSGIGQAAKLYGAGTKAAEAGKTAEEVSAIRKGVGFGESFGESVLGRAWEKGASTRQLAKARSLQVGKGLVSTVGDTTGVGTGRLLGGKGEVPDLGSLFEEELSKPALIGQRDLQTIDYVAPKNWLHSEVSETTDFAPISSGVNVVGQTVPFDRASLLDKQIAGRIGASNRAYDLFNESISWQERMMPSKLLRKPGGFDPRY